jgi:hypothetical protein
MTWTVVSDSAIAVLILVVAATTIRLRRADLADSSLPEHWPR